MVSVLAICIGASVGALGRWGLGLWLNHPGALLPWGTLAANLVGGYLVGIAPSVLTEVLGAKPVRCAICAARCCCPRSTR